MTHLDAEKLLGGHAAGILTPEEKQVLFTAALANQELFNALADEEALRELLADPDTRRHLLALLAEPTPAKISPFWHRPALLGLAASFFVLVTTSVVLWQRDRPLPSLPLAKEKAVVPPTLAEPPAARVAAEQDSVSKFGAAGLHSETRAKGGAAGTPPTIASAPPAEKATLADTLTASERGLMKAEAAPVHPPELKKRDAAKAQPAAGAEVVAETAPQLALSKEPSPALARSARETPAGVSGKIQPPTAPIYALERMENGKIRLSVTWATGYQLYAIKRSAVGPTVLRPITTATQAAGTTLDTFECTLGPDEHVDLYLVFKPVQDPKRLPADGPFEGFRTRVL